MLLVHASIPPASLIPSLHARLGYQLRSQQFWACVQGYVDVAQHREWAETTGGTMYLYHPFDPTLDYDELLNDLLWNVRREQGLEALLRVRCSSGIDVEKYHGAFLKRETGAQQ